MMETNTRYTSWNVKAKARKPRCSPQTRMEQGRKFKAMFSSLGLSVADAANFLQVSPRTVQLWVSGRVRIPYAAYKLMRLQLRYELPGEAWKDWHISAGRLYTPEGHELNPLDFSWWSLLVRRAAMFDALYKARAGVQWAADPRKAQRVDRPPAAVPVRLPECPTPRKVVARTSEGGAQRHRDDPPLVITGITSRRSTI